jgi:hypothetical protein
MCRYVIPVMLSQGSGTIVNNASIQAGLTRRSARRHPEKQVAVRRLLTAKSMSLLTLPGEAVVLRAWTQERNTRVPV